MVNVVLALVGLLIGGAIGYGFGAAQRAALQKHKKMQDAGHLPTGWLVVPGSMTRVAVLLLVLVTIQLLLPFLFQNANLPWFLTGGVVLGYGWAIFRTAKSMTTT